MDVLNKNQRNSARWRILAVLGILLVLNGLVVYSMHGAYKSTGQGDIEELELELQKQEKTYKGKVIELSNQNEILKKEIAELKSDDGEDPLMAMIKLNYDECKEERDKLEKQVEKKDEKIEKLREQLALCK